MSKRRAERLEEDENSQKRAKEILERVNSICCPITCEVMEDPVILYGDGQSYERSAIVEWLEKQQTSPLHGSALDEAGATLKPNIILRTTIDAMLKESRAAQEALADPAALREGALVEMHSLKGATELNGLPGELGPFDAQTGRFVVTVLSSGASVKVRSTNLRRRYAPDEDSAAAMQLAIETKETLSNARQVGGSYLASGPTPGISGEILTESRAKLERAIELDFGCGLAHRVLADVAADERDFGKMVKALTRAAANGGGTEARIALAGAHGRLEQVQKERDILASVLESEPRNFLVRFFLAQHLICVGDDESATLTLRYTTFAGPNNVPPFAFEYAVDQLKAIYRRQGLCGTFDTATAGLREMLTYLERHAGRVNPEYKFLITGQLAEVLLLAGASGSAEYATLEALQKAEDVAGCALRAMSALSAPPGQTVSWAWHSYGRLAELVGDAHASAHNAEAAVPCYERAMECLELAAAAWKEDRASRQHLKNLPMKIKALVPGSGIGFWKEGDVDYMGIDNTDGKYCEDMKRMLIRDMECNDPSLQDGNAATEAALRRSADRRPDPFARAPAPSED